MFRGLEKGPGQKLRQYPCGEKLDRGHQEQDAEDVEHQGETQERADTTEADLGKVSDASARIETDVAVSELVKAKEAALKDIEFLGEQVERAREAREESERIQQELESRVRASQGG